MKKLTIATIAIATVVAAGAVGGTAISQVVGVHSAEAQEFRMAGHRGGWRGRGDGPRGMMRDLMRQADANGDRALTQEEVDAFVDQKVALGDGNADGALTLDEFRAVFMDLAKRRIVDAFQRQDEDGDGVISAAEIDERFGDIVERMDRNDDGVLDRSDRRRHRRDRG